MAQSRRLFSMLGRIRFCYVQPLQHAHHSLGHDRPPGRVGAGEPQHSTYGVYPDYFAPVAVQGEDGRRMKLARWGLASKDPLDPTKPNKGTTNVLQRWFNDWEAISGASTCASCHGTTFPEPTKLSDRKTGLAWFAFGIDALGSSSPASRRPGTALIQKINNIALLRDADIEVRASPTSEGLRGVPSRRRTPLAALDSTGSRKYRSCERRHND